MITRKVSKCRRNDFIANNLLIKHLCLTKEMLMLLLELTLN